MTRLSLTQVEVPGPELQRLYEGEELFHLPPWIMGQVASIAMPGEGELSVRDDVRPDGPERVDTITLPSDAAKRLLGVFTRFYVDGPDPSQPANQVQRYDKTIDCRSSALYIAGLANAEVFEQLVSVEVNGQTRQGSEPHLKSGRTYSIGVETKPPAAAWSLRGLLGRGAGAADFRHFMIGTDDPSRNLSVYGLGGPLIVTDNSDLTRAYQSDVCYEVAKVTR
jgi:hypothetical protein